MIKPSRKDIDKYLDDFERYYSGESLFSKQPKFCAIIKEIKRLIKFQRRKTDDLGGIMEFSDDEIKIMRGE